MEHLQDYGKNPAEALFFHAQQLPEGEKVSLTFPSKQQANAFRIRLYRTRQRTNDFSVTINLNENTVNCIKEKRYFQIVHTTEEGKEELQTLTFRSENELKEDRQKELAEKAPLAEIIDLFNKDVKEIEKGNFETKFKHRETELAFTKIFTSKGISAEYLLKEAKFSYTEDGVMSYIRLLTKEEKDALS